MSSSIFLIFSLCYCYVYCRDIKSVILEKNNGLVKPPPRSADVDQEIPEQYFDQILDHYNENDNSTWKQRYYTNAEYYKPGGPAYIFVGGEGPIDVSWMTGGLWFDSGRAHNGILFQVEHRFYGKSHPTSDVSNENIKYLTSHQALADLAYFIDSMIEMHQMPNGTKWVTFGGSYPGNLAAWMRLKYPERVHAAISSSAPVMAKNITTYFVSQSLGAYNPQCVHDIKSATTEMEELLKNDTGKERLGQLFHLCDNGILDNEYDTANFFEAIGSIFAHTVQYNNDLAKDNINTLCQQMVDASKGTPIERYADIASSHYGVSNFLCFYISYNSSVNGLKNVKWSQQNGGREWFYQTCNEFGYYQTSEHNSIFGSKVFLDYYLRQCRDAFGESFDQQNVYNSVDETNQDYGRKGINVTRVYFVNGSIDPWHRLGITNSTDPEKPAVYIIGGSHAQDMYSIGIFDTPQMASAKFDIYNKLSEWLME